ncbi:putative riboflavin biosynthesis protein Rib7 [Xylariales sp. PMI_506]|nr:putative riboflavin biosynthesis protein Rib7 [Xylariales sp. PMI_506]
MGDQELCFPQSQADMLGPYLPQHTENESPYPFVTLTFATSLDSQLSLAPGTRTVLSGPQSKSMTHFLRSRHDAICVGVGTAVADNPGLNCRLHGVGVAGQPRPVVIDPKLRWQINRESKVLQLVREGRGLAPLIITANSNPPDEQRALLEEHGGKYVIIGHHGPNDQPRFDWKTVLRCIRDEGLQSIMIEGGGQVINSLLEQESEDLIDSVIVTIAPTWLGRGGVVVSPARRVGPSGQPIPAARLADTSWIPLGDDVVLCGKLTKDRL